MSKGAYNYEGSMGLYSVFLTTVVLEVAHFRLVYALFVGAPEFPVNICKN
jgi:hypothetical protein